MKSNICKLNEDLTCLEAVLAEVEKVTAYNGLEDKKALRPLYVVTFSTSLSTALRQVKSSFNLQIFDFK